MPHDLYADIDYVLIDQEKLETRINELAHQIMADYEDEDDLLLLCILRGSYIFVADLSRALTRPHEVDFMAVSSYGAGTKSSGAVQIMLDMQQDISERNIVIVEDIIDTGLTLSYLRENLLARRPKSLKICTLLSKPARHEVEVPVDYLGFEVPDEFVVGYGLDYGQLYRNIPYVAVLKPAVFS